MDEYLDSVCPNKHEIDKNAKEYAYSYQEEEVHLTLEQYEEEEAEIVGLLDEDYHRQLLTEETIMEYATNLYRIRRVIFYLRERFHGIIENNTMDELMDCFESMNT
jgi:hypothetical protein